MIITLQTLIFFRQTVLNVLDRILRPYYNKLSVTFGKNSDITEEEEPEEQVFSEFDDEKGVVFYPPVYLQRYAAVSDCLLDERWAGKLHKVVELGYHDLSFIKYLKEVPGIRCILAVDIESAPLRCSTDLVGYDDYGPKRDSPLQITLFQGNAADPDYRLIGCDAVVAIEMIEHMLPHDLDRLIHTVFGFIKPWIVIFTTPNADFNVLFKALGKNGLRRWDHYFEWTREQFHDWCSNIVNRYQNYTVSCKGIGPGPPGTIHLGCCSQMALFISKDYNKQQDLSINSLALVSGNAPNPEMTNLIGTWDKTEVPSETNMLFPPDNIDSLAEFTHTFEQSSENKSCLALMYTSQKNSNTQYSVDTESLLRKTAISLAPFAQHDKTSQCNLEAEAGKNYKMLDYEQMCYAIVVPRKRQDGRVYMIEDVNNRLNCTSIHVKSFSKTTQNLINKNKDLALVHTREVVDEIRHLTKMLNFNKDSLALETQENGVQHWRNINWGVDAPYWNQYYKVVKEYNSPYEIKSDECRITELISDEINRLIDNQFDDVDIDLNRLEIPIEQLMLVVSHITKDVEKVKDLLEWDGYEIVDDLVIHSRIVVDTASTRMTNDDDWPENETYSDWESTDVRSTTLSDGSTMVPDQHAAKCLRRALDQKVRKLRTMLTADEDISTELDKVVCRLMKLALRTSEGRRQPPPSKWLQCKLLDLLTLTEKAIQRRKRHSVENTISQSVKVLDFTALEKIKEDDTATKIVDKYKYLVNSENPRAIKDSHISAGIYGLLNGEFDDDLSVTSADYRTNYKYADLDTGFELEPNLQEIALLDPTDKKSKLERTQAWLEEDVKPTEDRSFNIEMNFDNDVSSGGDTEHSTSHRYSKESYRRYKKKNKCIELKCMICKKSHSKVFENDLTKHRASKSQSSKTKIVKKLSKKKSTSNIIATDSSTKYVSVGYRQYRVKSRKKEKPLHPTASKPIPASLIELCHPELVTDNKEVYNDHANQCIPDEHVTLSDHTQGISATKHSNLIEIVTAETRETIAMKRTIGTAPEEAMNFENETVIRDNVFDKHDAEPDEYQTIFLNDINEPSTSKGIRHISMDVQCGPDVSVPDYLLSATTSTRMNSIFTAGIKIGSSSTDTKVQNTLNCTEEQLKSTTNCCTSTYFEEQNFEMITPRKLMTGIKIKDTPYGAEQVKLPVTLEQDSMTDRQGSPIHVTTEKTKSADCSNKVQNTFKCTEAQLKSTTNCSTSINFEEGDFDILNLESVGPRKPTTGIKIKDKPNVAEQMDCLVTLEQDSMADTQRSPSPVKHLTERAKSADCSLSSTINDRRATVIPISNLPRLRHTSKLQKNETHKRELVLMPLKQGSQSPQSDKTSDMEPILDSPKLKRRSLIPQKQYSPTRKPGSAGKPNSISPIRRQISSAPKNELISPIPASPSVIRKQPTKRKVISPNPGCQFPNTQRPESRREQEPYISPRSESPIQICKKSKIPRLDSPRDKNLTPMIRQQESPHKNTRYSMIPRSESPNKLGSPTRLYAPNTQNSPNRLNSPSSQNAPNRLNSPNRPNLPNKLNASSELNSPNILNSLDRHNALNRLTSPNQYLFRKSESPTIGKSLLQRSKSPIQTKTAMYDQKPQTQNQNSPDMHYKPTMARERDFLLTSFGKEREVDWINSILSVSPTRDLNLALVQKKLPTVIQERDFDSAENQEIGLKNSNLSVNTKFSGATKCLKSVPSSIKMDSGSEFYGSFASMPKTTLSLATCDLNTTPFIKKDVGDSKKLTRYIRPKLCYGGVQVHSYRDKESSEDVMFQGGWQNYRPKVFTKRKICNPIKRITESVSKRRICPKEKISVTSYLRNNIPTPRELPPTRKIEQVKMNQSVVKNEYIPKAVGNIKKPFRNVVKAPSKLTMSSVSSKYSTKSVSLVVNPSKAMTCHAMQKDDKQTNKALTTTKYLPSYLRKKTSEKKLKTRVKCARNLSQHSSKTYVSTKMHCPKLIERSHAEKIRMDLLKLQNRLAQPNYFVLRNEIEQNSSKDRTAKKTDSGKRRCGPSVTRNLSPQSQHSSTCSSNSVATVRAVASLSKNVPSHRHSNSSYRSSTANSSSESSTPNRNKKFIKRCKNQKIQDDKKFDNKENIPQTSRQPNSCGSKGCEKKSKGAFPTQQKVFVAHLKESPPLHAAYKKPKSNVNLTKTDSLIEKRSKSPTISRVSSLKSEDLIPTHDNTVGASTGTSNMVLVLEPQRTQHAPSTSTPKRDGSHLTADWMNNTLCSEGKMLHVENVETAMKNLVVKALDFIDEPLESCSSVSSSTVILKREGNNNELLDLTSSPISFKTVITNDEDTSFQKNLENALYRSFDNESSSSVVSLTADTRLAVTDFDMASFKSSATFLKHSGHGSARSSRLKLASNSNSVKDIYERKDQPFALVPPNNASAVANQAFSGFSLDVDLIGGDKPDPINRMDSETGSLAADATRQANSEELFVSGRSSDSFQSCAVDDDVVVPGWLFQIISQQQAAEEEEPDPPLPVLLPIPDNAMFDVNGNDSIGMGAGAGDGRGIHSDPSQDSSGRGTSLSSSVTSSGQSGAVLLDPSAFVAQFEGGAALLQDSEDSSLVIVGVTDDGFEIVASDPVQTQTFLQATPSFCRVSRRPHVDVASDADADADVSSLETDVPDSS